MKVRIRMYNAGLGDCFLLSFIPEGKPEAHVLIDCGVLIGTQDAMNKMVARVENIAADTKGHLSALVATHEHWDHISGFVQARSVFDDVSKFSQIDQLWFAWTEAPADELAQRLQKDRDARKKKLKLALTHWNASVGARPDPTSTAKINQTRTLLGFGEPDLVEPALGAAGGSTTAAAMKYLKDRKEPKQYLEPGQVCAVPGLDGVRVYVLGPPRDERLLKKGIPSKKARETYVAGEALGVAEAFFLAVEAADADVVAAETKQEAVRRNPEMLPFDPYFQIPKDKAKGNEDFRAYFEGDKTRQIDGDWLGATSTLALALDNDTNNTSLVLAFELPNRDVLLFPGDAQVGNWLSWQDVSFKITENGKDTTITANDLLARTVFYKVGHHASHNATLRDNGLEKMIHPGLTAMIPVEGKMAETRKWAMPFPALLERLNTKCKGRVIRLDGRRENHAPRGGHARDVTPFEVKYQDLYVEYELAVSEQPPVT